MQWLLKNGGRNLWLVMVGGVLPLSMGTFLSVEQGLVLTLVYAFGHPIVGLILVARKGRGE